MQRLKRFTNQRLKMNPEQVQIFVPAPSTYSALMYYTGMDPFNGKPIFVEKDLKHKEKQKDIVTKKQVSSPFHNRKTARHHRNNSRAGDPWFDAQAKTS